MGGNNLILILIQYFTMLALILVVLIREDTHKIKFFLVVGPLRFYTPYMNGLVVHATFFFFFFFLRKA